MNQDPDFSGEPLCSICIANYNGIEIIEECIQAVLSQQISFPFEVIIHDDASTDESVRLIKERFPQVRMIASSDNVGFCVSNNRMASVARGKYILLLNNDAILLPDALRTLYDHAAQEPAAILSLPQYDADTGALLDIGSLTDPFLNSVPNLDATFSGVAMVAGACMWVPKSLWDKIGGFPEWFHTLAEDLYLCCVARLWGHSIIALPKSGYRHWVGRSLGGGKIQTNGTLVTSRHRRALTERNKTYVMCLCYPTTWLIGILPLHLFLLLLEGLLISLIKRDLGIWKTVYAPLPPSLWRSRHKIVALRKHISHGIGSNPGKSRLNKGFTLFPHKLRMLLKYGIPAIR